MLMTRESRGEDHAARMDLCQLAACKALEETRVNAITMLASQILIAGDDAAEFERIRRLVIAVDDAVLAIREAIGLKLHG